MEQWNNGKDQDFGVECTLMSVRSSPRRSSLGQMINQSTILLMVSIGTLILVLALMILFHQNANATKGYMLRTLERERSKLLLEEEVLNMEIAQEQSLTVLQDHPQIDVMVVPQKVQYTEEYPTVASD